MSLERLRAAVMAALPEGRESRRERELIPVGEFRMPPRDGRGPFVNPGERSASAPGSNRPESRSSVPGIAVKCAGIRSPGLLDRLYAAANRSPFADHLKT